MLTRSRARERRSRSRVAAPWLALGALLLVPFACRAQGPRTPAVAHRRLRVGLVLSGGGARGAAHIGVLEALARLRIPIDAIAGTSMGAVVGGLYASGMSGRQIQRALTAIDWQSVLSYRPPRSALDYRRKQEQRQYLVNLPLGLQGKRLVIPRGLVQPEQLTELLRRLTLPVARISDFNRLPTPFRAVATDLTTGAPVVIGHGDLTTAMRASMSVPGLFAPVSYQGKLLVDGGLSENLPLAVARQMGVDVLIVVDTGFPLQTRRNLNTIAGITNQMITILVRRNASSQLKALRPGDILISPKLGDFSSYDFADALKTVSDGAQAVEAVASELAPLEVSKQAYARYLRARAARRRRLLPRVDALQVQANSPKYRRPIDDLFRQFVGHRPDPKKLQQQIDTLYARGYMQLLDYHLTEPAADRYDLDVTAQRNSWGPNYLRFGLALQDDFQGNTAFDAAGRLDFTELNSLGAESIWNVQVGTAPLLGTELYLPLSNVQRYFFAPHVQIEAHNVAQVEHGKQVGQYRVSSFDAGIDFGRELGNWGELRLGTVDSRGHEHVSLGDFSVPSSNFNIWQTFLRFGADTLDSASFPHSGQTLTAQLSIEGNGGGAQGSNQVTLDWLHAWTRGKNTAVVWLSGGATVGGSQTDVRSFFPLGGFLHLSGVRTDTLAGPQYGIGRLILLHQVGRGGQGILDVPAYLGMSIESGNVWATRRQVSLGSLRTDFALFFGADTYIGPAYLAAGYDQSGSMAFYLFVGSSF